MLYVTRFRLFSTRQDLRLSPSYYLKSFQLIYLNSIRAKKKLVFPFENTLLKYTEKNYETYGNFNNEFLSYTYLNSRSSVRNVPLSKRELVIICLTNCSIFQPNRTERRLTRRNENYERLNGFKHRTVRFENQQKYV